MSNWVSKSRKLFKNNQSWLAVQAIKEGIESIPDWKEEAKQHVAKARILKALTVMKKHNIATSHFVARFKKYKKKEDQVLSEKRTYTSVEYAAQTKIFNKLAFDIVQAIDGTQREMPEYLK